MRTLVPLFVLCVLPLTAGCVRFEYDLVAPPDLAQHIGEQNDVVFTRNRLLFRLRSVDNFLVIRMENPGDETIRLVGGDSVVVDPQGMSRPLLERVIPPHAWIKLILPPPPPRVVYAPGPAVTLGFGTGGPGWSSGFAMPVSPPPRIYREYPFDSWTWEGETDVRLILAIQYGNEPPHTEQFVFHRRRM